MRDNRDEVERLSTSFCPTVEPIHMATSAGRKRKTPTTIREALEQRALDLGHVFVVLKLPRSSFDDALTQRMPVVGEQTR
jgi:hypothetical protein